jgi:FAD/FMN-containing dehydrogenase
MRCSNGRPRSARRSHRSSFWRWAERSLAYPADATAFPFRDARWLINVPATWREAADDEREIAWARETYAAIEPFLSEGKYVNFMGDDEDDAAAGAYGRTFERLQEVKAEYDPENVFRLNQNIVPAVRA